MCIRDRLRLKQSCSRFITKRKPWWAPTATTSVSYTHLAAGVSTEGAKVDSTLYKGGKAYELDAVSVTGSRAPMTVEQSPKIGNVEIGRAHV